MTIATAAAITSTATANRLAERAAIRAERAIRAETAEREGLHLITADDLATLGKLSAIRAAQNGKDAAQVESDAVRYLAIYLAKYGTAERLRMVRAAVKRAANAIDTRTMRKREAAPTAAERFTAGGAPTYGPSFDAEGARVRAAAPAVTAELSAEQRAAVTAAVQWSNLSPVCRDYAAKGKTGRVEGNAKGAEGAAWNSRKVDGMRAALDLALGAEMVELLHAAYVAEARTTRNGSKNAIGTVTRTRHIAWSQVAAAVNVPRGTLAERVAKSAAVAVKRADIA